MPQWGTLSSSGSQWAVTQHLLQRWDTPQRHFTMNQCHKAMDEDRLLEFQCTACWEMHMHYRSLNFIAKLIDIPLHISHIHMHKAGVRCVWIRSNTHGLVCTSMSLYRFVHKLSIIQLCVCKWFIFLYCK